MTLVVRVDAELVRRGLARSRGHAADLVRAGRVRAGAVPVTKPSHSVESGADLEVAWQPGDGDVGRGAAKLRGALEDFRSITGSGPAIDGRRCVDVGASTGGFTQVLLAAGAAHVVALDVGHDQLAAVVAADPRVTERSGTTVRGLQPADVDGPFDLLVADLSFISLTLVMRDLAQLTAIGGDLLILVKPQFEIGRERLGRDGVVRSAQQRHEAIERVRAAMVSAGLQVRAEVTSRTPGSTGNEEYFLWAQR